MAYLSEQERKFSQIEGADTKIEIFEESIEDLSDQVALINPERVEEHINKYNQVVERKFTRISVAMSNSIRKKQALAISIWHARLMGM